MRGFFYYKYIGCDLLFHSKKLNLSNLLQKTDKKP